MRTEKFNNSTPKEAIKAEIKEGEKQFLSEKDDPKRISDAMEEIHPGEGATAYEPVEDVDEEGIEFTDQAGGIQAGYRTNEDGSKAYLVPHFIIVDEERIYKRK